MSTEPLVDQFLGMLDDVSTSEQCVQDFLEEHTEFFYPPFEQNHGIEHDLLVSKFQIDTTLTTDFAYLTKSSARWWLVLVELEHPSKSILTKAGVASADLTAAIHQVNTWRTHVTRNLHDVIRRIAPLRKPMSHTKVFVKYALVIGRSKDFEGNHAKTDAFEGLQRDDLAILTYDSLVHAYQKSPNTKLDVVCHKKEKFGFKHRHRTTTDVFSWLTNNDIALEEDDIAYYKNHGYDIDQWQRGERLVAGGKTMATVRNDLTKPTPPSASNLNVSMPS